MNSLRGHSFQDPDLAADSSSRRLPRRIFDFYRDGFARMRLGRTLWKIIILKLIIMFAVLKLFFFQGFLETKFETDEERAAYVLDEMTRSAKIPPSSQEETKND